MDLDYNTIVAFAKSFGLFYLVAMSIGVIIYAYWPSKKKQFERAAEAILESEDRPWR
jgi:cytochrome c oxidase cbb3-type subunit 4